MSATNHTANYGLSQFLGTDKPAWLVDYNGDMAAIDQGIKDAADAASAAQTTANTADGKADTNAANITTLDTQINGVSGIATDVTTLQGSVNTITSLIGNGEPTTTDKTLIGAINEINGKVTELPTNSMILKGETSVTITAGVSDKVEDACKALYDAFAAVLGNLADDEYVKITRVRAQGVFFTSPRAASLLINDASDIPSIEFSDTYINDSNELIVNAVKLSGTAANVKFDGYKVATDGTITFTQVANDSTLASGAYAITYDIYEKVK